MELSQVKKPFRPRALGPKILLLDIETTPDLVWTWGVYDQNAIEVKEHWQILSYSAKWFGTSAKAITRGVMKPMVPLADREVVKELWELLDEADSVVAHNGARFDLRKIRARFIAHDLTPPSPYEIIDTKNEAARIAAFSSNRLNWLCGQLGLGEKVEHEGFPLWRGCMNGDPLAWNRMLRYNARDIVILGRLYRVLAPWLRQHNVGTWNQGMICPNPVCKSRKMEKRGLYRSKTRVYQRFKCNKCGTWARGTHSETNQNAKLISVM